jgi:tRNA (guanine-N7-)-methyltransferase
VDTPARTAEFIAHRDSRRATLLRELAELLAGHLRITFEIGAGHGHFLTDYAAAHPAEFCVGIDLLRDRVERAVRKRDRAKLGNLVFLRAEAEECVAALPAHVVLQRIFVLFPDPWPKRRHHKNRIMQAAFLQALAERAKTGADLCFRTDDAAYFTAAKTVVEAHDAWSVSSKHWPFERATVFQSRAEVFQSLVAVRRETISKLQHKPAASSRNEVA